MFENAYFNNYVPTENQDILEDWRWLTGDKATPFMLTILGDAFLVENEQIFWLQPHMGSYDKVAESAEEFSRLFEENFEEWILPDLAAVLLEEKGELPANHCFSMDVPAVLGGQFSPENFNPCDLYTHFSMSGQFCAMTESACSPK